MGTSNPAESHTISSFRRMPFIAAGEPRDVPDLPIEDEAAPRPGQAATPEVEPPDVVGPPPPPRKAGARFGLSWQWGLLCFGVLAAAGFGGLMLYQGMQPLAPVTMATSPRPALNSSTALSAPRDASTRPAQAPAARPAAVKVEAAPPTSSPAPAPTLARSDAPSQALAAGPGPAASVEAAPPASAPTVAPSEGPLVGPQREAAAEPAPSSALPPATPSRPPATEVMGGNRKIVASPMMGDDQRQVLDLMAATNSIVLQVKREVDDDGKKMREMQAQLDDMKRMVSLNQARLLSGATQIAMGNIQPVPQAQPATDPQLTVSPQPTASPPSVAVQTPDMTPACRLRPSYIVASASPAHATLKNGAQVFISVRAPSRDIPQGDSIPCYGHILKITQEGSRWVVMTEHDVIGRN